MINLKKHHLLKETILIIVGTILMAMSINMVFDPMGMVTGGVTGIAIVVKDLSSHVIKGGIPVWITNALCNVPLFLGAYLVLGKGFIKKTLFATISLTIALYIVPTHSIVREDFLLAAVFGGVLAGAGIGLVFVTMSSTGGTDLLAMIIHKYKRYHSIPQILIVIDSIIVIAGVIVFGINRALYAVIAIYIATKVSDGILEGLKFAKTAYIISDEYDKIAEEIMTKMERGVTGISATGMYSKDDKKMLFCVVSKKEIVQITEIVNNCDPKAFIIVSDAREVMGEGFREYKQ